MINAIFIRMAGRPRPKSCEVCGREKRISFDHDHKTDKFRGWICHYCNMTLGFCEDNIDILKLLIKYLEKNSFEISDERDM